jgi:hypothetical protein
MAVSDIFGTNMFTLTLLFVVDAVAAGEAVLNGAGRFSTFAAIIGITVTMMFVAGVAERRDRTPAHGHRFGGRAGHLPRQSGHPLFPAVRRG